MGAAWFRIGRYLVVLTFDGVAEVEMNAPDHLGGIAACHVTTTRDALTLASCFLRHHRVTGQQLAATITLSGALVAGSVAAGSHSLRYEPNGLPDQ